MELSWTLVTVFGAAALGAVLFWCWLRTRSYDKQIDPLTPSDDPSQGMNASQPGAAAAPVERARDAD